MTKELVAAGQLGPCSEPRYDTVERIVRLIEQAGAEGVKLVVFPELALSPYFCAVIHEDITPFCELDLFNEMTAPIVEALQRTGVEITLPFGETQGASFYNSAALLGPFGEIGRFRKVHLAGKAEPDPTRLLNLMEKRYFVPGDLGFPVYQAASGRIGMLICADRRYPETYRCLGLGGAEIIAIGYNTPCTPGSPVSSSIPHGQEMSELAMRAGAYANNVYVIGSGKAGVEWGNPYIGGSVVIGTNGEIMAKAKTDGDELVIAEVDLARAEEARRQRDLPGNRRPETYAAITAVPALV